MVKFNWQKVVGRDLTLLSVDGNDNLWLLVENADAPSTMVTVELPGVGSVGVEVNSGVLFQIRGINGAVKVTAAAPAHGTATVFTSFPDAQAPGAVAPAPTPAAR